MSASRCRPLVWIDPAYSAYFSADVSVRGEDADRTLRAEGLAEDGGTEHEDKQAESHQLTHSGDSSSCQSASLPVPW